MTLKDYTDFVVKYALVAYNISPALATRREKKQLEALIEELATLVGPENWEKLVNVFMEKINFPKGFDKHLYVFENILWDKSEFTKVLAEFCEPLIGKEKPKGGQDAGKA